MSRRDMALCRYFRRIRSYLPCSRNLKKRILGEIQNNISSYLAENPRMDFEQVEAHFGTPQCIAAAYVDDMDTGELLRTMYIRRRIITAVTVCIAAIILMWGVVLGAAYVEAHNNSHSHYEFYIVED